MMSFQVVRSSFVLLTFISILGVHPNLPNRFSHSKLRELVSALAFQSIRPCNSFFTAEKSVMVGRYEFRDAKFSSLSIRQNKQLPWRLCQGHFRPAWLIYLQSQRPRVHRLLQERFKAKSTDHDQLQAFSHHVCPHCWHAYCAAWCHLLQKAGKPSSPFNSGTFCCKASVGRSRQGSHCKSQERLFSDAPMHKACQSDCFGECPYLGSGVAIVQPNPCPHLPQLNCLINTAELAQWCICRAFLWRRLWSMLPTKNLPMWWSFMRIGRRWMGCCWCTYQRGPLLNSSFPILHSVRI